ncbi:hypothetical protein [Paenibacillus sp. HJGM_3]|uniref:hypothetical protein n=1 Tax=Paenibacillus sp. HJGM_3 TaxID=3379816 RepID=UPI00385BF3BB
MKKTMFSRFNENKKWHDYFNFKAVECKLSLIVASTLFLLAIISNVHSDFNKYLVPLQSITLNIATALIGMLGTILAGIAIIIGILQKDIVKLITKLNGVKSIHNILVSFEFLAFNIGVGIILFYFLHFILYSTEELVSELVFYLIVFFVAYFFSFIVFYTLSLISNSIRVFYISNLYSDIKDNEKSVLDLANELRVDFILNILLKDRKITKEKFAEELEQYIDRSNIGNKDEIKKYLKGYYNY